MADGSGKHERHEESPTMDAMPEERAELLRHGGYESRWELRETDGPIYRDLVIHWRW